MISRESILLLLTALAAALCTPAEARVWTGYAKVPLGDAISSNSAVPRQSPQAEAKAQALQDLATNLKVNLRSTFASIVSEETRSASLELQMTCNLPLMGHVFVREEIVGNTFEVVVELKAEEALPKYIAQITRILDLATETHSGLVSTDGAIPVSVLETGWQELMDLQHEYERYSTVARLLDSEGSLSMDFPVAKTEIQTQLSRLALRVDSGGRAIRMITRELLAAIGKELRVMPLGNQLGIYVGTPRHHKAANPLSFSLYIKDRLQQQLPSTVSSLFNATHLLDGHYTVYSDHLELVLYLRNLDGITIGTSSVRFPLELFEQGGDLAHLEYLPKTDAFESFLYSGQRLERDFQVRLRTHLGDENLSFEIGETVEFFVKANDPCSFIIVGYSILPGEPKNPQCIAYLMEVNNAEGSFKRGPSRFVKTISADETGQWISLGEFSVVDPIGVESLQLFAFEGIRQSEIQRIALPEASLDTRHLGLYTLKKGKMNDVIQLIEDLRSSQFSLDVGVKIAESSLSYVTFPAETSTN